MPNPKLTKGFRLAATVLIDNYWIPRQEVERYLARRQYWSQRLMTYMSQAGWQAQLDFEGSQDGLAVLGLDTQDQIQALIHLDPANLAAHLFYGSRRMPEGITLTFHVKKPYPFKY